MNAARSKCQDEEKLNRTETVVSRLLEGAESDYTVLAQAIPVDTEISICRSYPLRCEVLPSPQISHLVSHRRRSARYPSMPRMAAARVL